MKIASNINGNQKNTSYADFLYYRSSPISSYTKINRAFFRDISRNPNAQYTQVYQYDDTPPVITVTSSLADTVNQKYTLTGTIKDIHSGVASATVNGYNLTVTNDNFSKNFTLSGNTGMSGINYFTITAIDNAGNSSSITVSVNYINQSNNNNYNWSTHQRVGDNPNKAYDDLVYVNGTWYTYAQKRWSDAPYDHDGGGYHHTDVTATVNTSIPLPKGLSSLTFNGWNCTSLNIRDASTNSYIATGQNSVSASLTQEQAMHDLYIDINAQSYQYSYQYATADCGVSSWAFNYY